MIVIVALFRDLLLREIRSQRSRRLGAIGANIVLSGRHREYEGYCFSTVPRVMSGLRAELKRPRGW